MDCGICTRKIMKSKIIECPTCSYQSCNKCLKTYFKEISEPRCPNCLVVWTREFVMTNFSSFKKEYTKMRERFLFERELALMPDSQHFAENELKARELINVEIKKIQVDINELRRRITELDRKRSDIYLTVQHLRNLTDNRDHQHAPKLICKCPLFSVSGCRGFIYDNDWKCGLCQAKICSKCLFLINPEETHKCKDEDIESVAQIKKDSKPCPKCASLIYKIDGCDQMWCTQCQTAFSWKTGAIVNGRVHNPHFYEWQRQLNNGVAPRVVEDGECGYVQIQSLITACRANEYSKFITRKMTRLHQFVGHLNEFVISPAPVNNLNLRILYLLKEIEEKDFIRTIQQLDKKFLKESDIRNVTEVFINEVEHIFRAIIETNISGVEVESKLSHVMEFVNTQFKLISAKYQTVPKKLLFCPDTNSFSF